MLIYKRWDDARLRKLSDNRRVGIQGDYMTSLYSTAFIGIRLLEGKHNVAYGPETEDNFPILLNAPNLLRRSPLLVIPLQFRNELIVRTLPTL